jgi:NTP pyrophosphatase (non-canonical NTP hydrolase)
LIDVKKIQAELRQFADARDWRQFHKPKNLAMALSVEVAELVEIFQWMTPEQAENAHKDPLVKGRIADEVADILIYLIQFADHSEIDLEHAVIEKIKKNAIKHPPKAN